MKPTFETIDGEIVGFDINKGELTIKAKYSDWDSFFASEYNNCRIQLINGHPLSNKQRKACYVILQDIANWSGMRLEETKRVMKDKFLEDYDGADFELEDFSLKDAPATLISDFQDFLVDFVLSYDIPTKTTLKDTVNSDRYMYSCIKNRKCCVCGKQASLFTNSSGLTTPVCGAHRIELLTDGSSFYEKYNIKPIFYLSEDLQSESSDNLNIAFEGD